MNEFTPDSNRTQAATPEQERTTALRSAIALFPDGYEKHELVGKGGMGIVYRARDVSLDRDIAIKLLQDQFDADGPEAKRFLEEARITAQLQHPGIPAIHEVGTMNNGRPFIAMKLIKGDTLDALLKKPDARPAQFLAAFEGIAFALGYAHSRQVIHRDLKPANVMIGAFGEVQLMDWGLAKLLTGEGRLPSETESDLRSSSETRIRPSRSNDSDTRYGDYMGTPAFMPPEQAIGAIDKINERSDVFGLGAILCMILTGKPPFVGLAETCRQQSAQGKLQDAFAALDACGAESGLIALAKRCLSVETSDRPANSNAVAKEVAKLRSDADDRAKQAEIGKARSETRRRVLTWSAAVVVAVLSAGVVSAWALAKQARDAEQATRDQLTETQKAEALATAKKKELEDTLAVVNQRTKLAQDVFDVQNMPGSPEVKRAMLERARDGLAKLLEEARQQAMPDSALVWSHLRMGDVELQLENKLAAQKQYQAGHAIAERRAAADPKGVPAQRDLAVSLDRLGAVAEQLGNKHEASEFYKKGLAVRQRLADADPTNAELQRDLGGSFDQLGNVAEQRGQTKQALDYYQNGLAIVQRLAADVTNTQAQRELAGSFSKLANVMSRLGRSKESIEYYRKEVDVRQRLADADPTNVQAQRDLSFSILYVASGMSQRSQTKEAIELYQKCLAIDQRLADADPMNSELQSGLSSTFGNLWSLATQYGPLKLEVDVLQKKLAVDRRRVEADPTNTYTQDDLGRGYDRLGDVMKRQNKTKEALEFFRMGLDARERFATSDPTNALAQSGLCLSLNNYGRALWEFGQLKEAAVYLRKERDLWQQLADADPANLQSLINLSRSLEENADLAQKMGQPKEAVELYRQSVAIDRRLAEADPSNVKAQRDLADRFNRLGEVILQLNQLKDAAEFYQKGLDVRRSLADAGPADAQAERDVRDSLNRLAQFFLQMGDVKQAEELYRKRLASEQRLTAAAPMDVQTLRDMGYTLDRLGEAMRLLGKPKEAAEFVQQSGAVNQRLKELEMPLEVAPPPREAK